MGWFDWKQPESLDLRGLAAVFEVDEQWLQAEVDAGRFVAPLPAEDVRSWDAYAVWSWMARHHPFVAAGADLRYWAPCTRPEYLGVREVSYAVVQDWRIEGVPLRVVWPLPPDIFPYQVQGAVREALALVPPVPRVIQVGGYGPSLSVGDETDVDRSEEGNWWVDLAAVLGSAAPYWPFNLRTPEVMRRWRPGAAPTMVAAVPSLQSLALLRLAAMLPPDSAAARVLYNIVRQGEYAAAAGALREVKNIVEDGLQDRVTFAAVPMPVPEPAALDEQTRRAGLLEILDREDSLAWEVICQIRAWDGAIDLPASVFVTVDPATSCGAEWRERLRPATRLSATYALATSDLGTVVEYLVDPLTDAPVVQLADGNLRAMVAQRIPASSALSEVILEEPIWVRLDNGALYLAPRGAHLGLSWGYNGSGPYALAQLVNLLLDDIASPGVKAFGEVPAGLLEAMRRDWPAGTRFSRSDLEAAADAPPSAADGEA
ncbi:hypothetical protein [Nocardia transvalensis]|uniref:hypothetical protein n=1 Tax=Nocardia transvalensis TaxID=37333 RepID=UPI0018944B93|nr:hypothetical protein [Nocardia transvalensis]MBF6333483.1 hypothetical protein [Nocardia transvalensis]